MPFDLSEKYVSEAEQALGRRLPESYRAAMIKMNGGEIDAASDQWTLLPILDKSDKKRLARTCNDIVRETKVKRDWAGWVDGAICIADNGTGDALIFLSEGNTCSATVYHWSHETGALEVVAEDFAELGN